MPNEDFRIKTGVDVDDGGVGQLQSIAEELEKTAKALQKINNVKFNGDIFSGLTNAGKNIQSVTKEIDKLQKSAKNVDKPISNIGKGTQKVGKDLSSSIPSEYSLLDLASVETIKSSMESIATSAQNLKETLGSEVTSGLMTQINEMLAKKDELQNLADILKSNREEINKAGKATGKITGVPKDTTSKYISDKYKRLSEIEPEYQRLSSPLIENTEEENNRLKVLQQERSTIMSELNSQMSEIRKASSDSEIGKARTSYLNTKNNIASNFNGDVINDAYTKLAVAKDVSFDGSDQVVASLTANINALTDAFNNGEISAEKYASSTQELFNGFNNTIAQIEPGNIEKATSAMENYLNNQVKVNESIKGNFARTEKENTVTMTGEFEAETGQLRKLQIQADLTTGEIKKVSEAISQVKKTSSTSTKTPKYTTDESYTGDLNYLMNTEAESQIINRYINDTRRWQSAIDERKEIEARANAKSAQNSTEQNAENKYEDTKSSVAKNLNKYDEQIHQAYTDLSALQQAKSGIQGLDKIFESGEREITKWASAVANGKMSIETFVNKVSGLKTSISSIGKVIDPDSITDAKGELETYLREITQIEDITFSGFTSKNGIATLKGTFKDSAGEAQTLTVQLNTLNGQIKNLGTSVKPAETGLSKFFSGWKEKMVNLAQYLTSFRAMNQIWTTFKQGLEIVKEFDTALTEMRKVSDEPISKLKEFQKESFDMAKSVGTTALQIQNSTADFMRLGEGMEDAAQSSVNANRLKNVSEFDNIDDATSALISMKAAYKDLSEESIIDKLNNIGNNYAVSTDELATGLQKSGAALSLMGNNIDESVALLSTANTQIQDISSVAAGVKTISLRIAGTEEAKKELEELGEDTSDYVVATKAKKQQIVKDYTAVASNGGKGVNILDSNGNLKNMFEIMKEIGSVYKEIQEEDKKFGTNRATALIEELAG